QRPKPETATGQVLGAILAGTLRLFSDGFGTALWVLAVVVLYALARLVISHGHVHSILREHCHPAAAACVTALVFAAGYLISPFVTPLALLNLVLAGLVLERLRVWSGSLWHPYGLLTGWVWLGLVAGQPLQGMPLVNRMWVFRALPAAVSGGVYGFEGGLVVTVMLSAGLLALLRARPRVPVRLTVTPPPPPVAAEDEPTL
ncbi:MAG: hypothetical protein HYU66_07620, partial [Armatimonadetes bacterium]|nr:hypothetical protein [Armatimonadota bacterium]